MSDFLERGVLRYHFYEYLEPAAADASESASRMYCCPCCDYPTNCEPAVYEICALCSWEDDGHAGYGPNACSLDDARKNFCQFLTSYGTDHKCAPDYPKPGEQHFVHEYELRPENLAAKRQLIQQLADFMAEPDRTERARLLALAFPPPPQEQPPLYQPIPGAITVFPDADGWTQCPTCNFRFNVRNANSIAESHHLRCKQLLNVVFPESTVD